MKNIPSKIYLQVGDDITPEEMKNLDFNDLGEVSWSSTRVYETDVEYRLIKEPTINVEPDDHVHNFKKYKGSSISLCTECGLQEPARDIGEIIKKWQAETPITIGSSEPESAFSKDSIIEVAERLYREANPGTKMDTPSYVYERVEAANKRRFYARSVMSLYDWCKQEQANSNYKKQ